MILRRVLNATSRDFFSLFNKKFINGHIGKNDCVVFSGKPSDQSVKINEEKFQKFSYSY